MLRFHQALMILLFCYSAVQAFFPLLPLSWWCDLEIKLTDWRRPVTDCPSGSFIFKTGSSSTFQNERKKNTIWNIDKLQIFSSVISKELWRLWWPRGSCWTKNKFVVCKDALAITMVAIIRRMDVTDEKRMKIDKKVWCGGVDMRQLDY